MHFNDAVLLQALQQLARVSDVAEELQPAAAHNFDRALKPIKAMLASIQQGSHMPQYAAAIVRSAILEADGVHKAVRSAARHCNTSSDSRGAAYVPTADQVAAAEKAAAAMLQVTHVRFMCIRPETSSSTFEYVFLAGNTAGTSQPARLSLNNVMDRPRLGSVDGCNWRAWTQEEDESKSAGPAAASKPHKKRARRPRRPRRQAAASSEALATSHPATVHADDPSSSEMACNSSASSLRQAHPAATRMLSIPPWLVCPLTKVRVKTGLHERSATSACMCAIENSLTLMSCVVHTADSSPLLDPYYA